MEETLKSPALAFITKGSDFLEHYWGASIWNYIIQKMCNEL